MFKFKTTQPCSGVGVCKRLPGLIIDEQIDLPIPAEDLRGLASSYLYMRDEKYDILQNEGKMSVSVQPGETDLADEMESTRTNSLLEALKDRVKKERYASIKVALAGKDMSCLCPFRGGGDIYLQTDHISACLRLSEEEEDEALGGAEEGTQVSPRQKGEIRCTATVENKFSAVQSIDKVRKQLQADMLVASTKQLKKILMNKPTKAKDIKSFTSYGITFGVSIAHPLILLKMTLDFETNKLKYFQLCRYEWSQAFCVYVDGAFEYVMERITAPAQHL